MKNIYEVSGKAIREIRVHKHLTREKLAEMAGISAKFLYEIETGRKGYSTDTLYRISRSLSVSSELILSGHGIYTMTDSIEVVIKALADNQIQGILATFKFIQDVKAGNILIANAVNDYEPKAKSN